MSIIRTLIRITRTLIRITSTLIRITSTLIRITSTLIRIDPCYTEVICRSPIRMRAWHVQRALARCALSWWQVLRRGELQLGHRDG